MPSSFRIISVLAGGLIISLLWLAVFETQQQAPSVDESDAFHASPTSETAIEFGGREETTETADADASPSPALSTQDDLFSFSDFHTAEQDDSAALYEFQFWVEDYLAAAPAQQERMLQKGRELAKARRPVMTDLIRHNPEKALSFALSRADLDNLPLEIIDFVETPFDARADFELLTTCSLDEHEHNHDLHRLLHIEGEPIEAFTYGERSFLTTKQNLPVHGIRIDEYAAVHESPVRFLEPEEIQQLTSQPQPGNIVVQVGRNEIRSFSSLAEAETFADELTALESEHGPYSADTESETAGSPDTSWTTGEKSVLYLRVDFEDRPGEPVRDEIAAYAMDEARDYYQGVSGGLVDLKGAIHPQTLRLPHSSDFYNENGYLSLRDAALYVARQAAGSNPDLESYHPDDYDVTILSFAQVFPNWIGRATIGGQTIWLNGFFSPGVTIHEIGHTFGLFHANAWEPNGQDPIGDGRHVEYADRFDVMGISSNIASGNHRDGHFNSWFKAYLGWLEEGIDWVEPTASGVHRLHPHDLPDTDGLRAIRISIGDGRAYWLEARSAFEDNEWLNNGISIRRSNTVSELMSNRGSELLDMTPDSLHGHLDHPLVTGNTFSDYERGIHIKTLDTGGSGSDRWVDVELRLDETPPPSITQHPENLQAVEGKTAAFRVEAIGSPTLHYQWLFEHEEIANANEPVLQFDSVGANHPGRYSVKVWNEHGSVFSESALLEVMSPDAVQAGSLDASFDPAGGANGPVFSILEQPDGRLLIAGDFTSVNGVSRNRIARLHADGSVDESFDPESGFDRLVWTLALDEEGRIYAGGTFTAFSGQEVGRIARLHSDGRIDSTFAATGADGPIRAILPLDDDSLLVGGAFSEFNGAPAGNIAAVGHDGAIDSRFSFGTGFDGPVWALTGTAYGILAGGAFGQFDALSHPGLAKLDYSGRPVPDFQVDGDTNGAVYSLAVQSNGRILVGGSFTRFAGAGAEHIARLHFDGSRDLSFHPEAATDDIVWSLAVASDDRIIVGGWYSNLAGASVNGLGRLLENGELDETFNAGTGTDGLVWPAILSGEGQILVAGSFTQYDSTARNGIARVFASAPATETAASGMTFADWKDSYNVPSTTTASDDPGSTGIAYLHRYAFGMDPQNPNREKLPSVSIETPGGNGKYLTVQYNRRLDAGDLHYIIEASSDLKNWVPIDNPQILEVTPQTEKAERITVLDDTPLGMSADQRFLRVRVQIRE